MTVLGVLVAGAIGAVGRHLLVVVLESRPRRRFPAGVIAANVAGSLVLGALVGARLDGGITTTTLTVVGTGFCGALTTWSTFVVDATERIQAGDHRSAWAVVVLSLSLGAGAAALGLTLTGGL
ncbi:N/A [soil metagenome]